MNKPFSSTSTKQLIANSLQYVLTGGLWIKNGHLPQDNHDVPTDFLGVCVASNEDPETDHFIIAQLETLGINHVRLDLSYQDVDRFNERFLNKLIAAGYEVTLHLFPPFDSAKNMVDSIQQGDWRSFLVTILDRYGNRWARA